MTADAPTFADFPVGHAATMTWPATAAEIDAFASLSGDHNPMHVDPAFAAARGFPDRIAHGMLLAAKLSAFAGMHLPGRSCLLLECSVAWPNPVLAGDVVTFEGSVKERSASVGTLKVGFRARTQRAGRAVTVGRGWYLCKVQS